MPLKTMLIAAMLAVFAIAAAGCHTGPPADGLSIALENMEFFAPPDDGGVQDVPEREITEADVPMAPGIRYAQPGGDAAGTLLGRIAGALEGRPLDGGMAPQPEPAELVTEPVTEPATEPPPTPSPAPLPTPAPTPEPVTEPAAQPATEPAPAQPAAPQPFPSIILGETAITMAVGDTRYLTASLSPDDGSFEVSGVAPDVTIMAIKADKEGGLPGEMDMEAAVRGIRYATDNGAHIINLSYGRPHSAGEDGAELRAIERAVSRGVLVVAAAGNGTGKPDWPAAYDAVLSVSSVSRYMAFYGSLSSLAGNDGIAAPGFALVSAEPGGGWIQKSGTSGAAALVSGVSALVLSQNTELEAGELKEALLGAARESGPPGRGGGR